MNKSARINEQLLAQNALLTSALVDVVKLVGRKSTAKKPRRRVNKPRVLMVWST
jgi:hypothetical protein